MCTIFQHVPVLDNLYLEHEFYSYDEPILFTCIDEGGTRYLCSCCYLGSQWVLAEMTSELLVAMIENTVTLRETFQKGKVCYFLQLLGTGYSITEDIPDDAFPREGEYLDLEDERTGAFYGALYMGVKNHLLAMEMISNYPLKKTCEFSNDLNRKVESSEFEVAETLLRISDIPMARDYSLNLQSSSLVDVSLTVNPSVDFIDVPISSLKLKFTTNPMAA